MGIQRPAFTTQRLDEERSLTESEVVGLKLNAQERAQLEYDKELLDIQGDSQTLKFLLEIGRRVVYQTFSAEQLQYLVSLKRNRYDGRKRRRK
jgi:hypothetical protein